jgi:hypothetical protein
LTRLLAVQQLGEFVRQPLQQVWSSD